MERERIARLLQRCDLLGELDRDELRAVAELARAESCPAGSALFLQGDPPDAFYVIERGEVRIVATSDDGREVVLDLLGPGRAFGEIAVLDGAPRTAGAIAATDLLLVRIPRRPFLALVEAHPSLALAIIALLCARLRHTSRRVEEDSFLGVRQRLLRHLLRLPARRTDEGWLIERLPQSELAASLAVSRQTINRHLQELQDDALIAVRRARIYLLDRDALGRAASATE